MAEESKKKRKVYFTVGGMGFKPGLDTAIKVGITKFNKRTTHKISCPNNKIFNESTRSLGIKKVGIKE